MNDPLLEVEDLTIEYDTAEGPLTAVSDVSFAVGEEEYFGLVGESGCGKSTIVKSIIGGLDANGRVTGGSIKFRGEELQDLPERELNRRFRWREISYIPQGSMNSLDPLERISDQAVEIGKIHTDKSKPELLETLRELFRAVGLAEERIREYPHQFSGGMQQRAIIALSLLAEPSLVIADEPTTALDVIMQDQIFKYLDRVKADWNMSILLITHDISVVLEECEKLAIMHSGQLAETGRTTELFDDPRHPYAILLQEAFPDIRDLGKTLSVIDGYPPQNIGRVDYCTFRDRCPWAVDECSMGAPPLEAIGSSDTHAAACIRYDEVHREYEAAAGGAHD